MERQLQEDLQRIAAEHQQLAAASERRDVPGSQAAQPSAPRRVRRPRAWGWLDHSQGERD